MGALLQFPIQSSCKYLVDGHCSKMAGGDASVTKAICGTCPTALLDCPHMRFSLCKHKPQAFTICRGGQSEEWSDLPTVVRYETATCVFDGHSVASPADCAGCTLRFVKPREPIHPGMVER